MCGTFGVLMCIFSSLSLRFFHFYLDLQIGIVQLIRSSMVITMGMNLKPLTKSSLIFQLLCSLYYLTCALYIFSLLFPQLCVLFTNPLADVAYQIMCFVYKQRSKLIPAYELKVSILF